MEFLEECFYSCFCYSWCTDQLTCRVTRSSCNPVGQMNQICSPLRLVWCSIPMTRPAVAVPALYIDLLLWNQSKIDWLVEACNLVNKMFAEHKSPQVQWPYNRAHNGLSPTTSRQGHWRPMASFWLSLLSYRMSQTNEWETAQRFTTCLFELSPLPAITIDWNAIIKRLEDTAGDHARSWHVIANKKYSLVGTGYNDPPWPCSFPLPPLMTSHSVRFPCSPHPPINTTTADVSTMRLTEFPSCCLRLSSELHPFPPAAGPGGNVIIFKWRL